MLGVGWSGLLTHGRDSFRETEDDHPMTTSGMSARAGSARIPAIDVVKGLAIIGVIAQHALTRENMDGTGADFWLRQSVPVLFVLMGFNAARAGLRRPAPTLAEAYGARYWRGRFRRILLPLLVVSAVALVVGAASGHLHLRALALVGYLPVPGPGVYWITILLTFTLIWPAVDAPLPAPPGPGGGRLDRARRDLRAVGGRRARLQGRRQPRWLSLRLRRLHPALLRRDRGRHVAGDRRRAGRRAAGSWSWRSRCRASRTSPSPEPTRPRSRTSCMGSRSRPTSPPCPGRRRCCSRRCTLWPARSVPGTGWLERLGVASYEVFLVQVVWLGVLQDRGLMHFLVAALASGLLGYALHRVLTATSVGSLRPRLRRRALARS